MLCHTGGLLFDAGSLTIGEFKLWLIQISGPFLGHCSQCCLCTSSHIYADDSQHIINMWHNEHLHTFYFPNKWVQWTWIIFCLLWVKFWLPAQILQDLVQYLPEIKTNEIYETRDNRVIMTDWFWGSQYWNPSQNNTNMRKKLWLPVVVMVFLWKAK